MLEEGGRGSTWNHGNADRISEGDGYAVDEYCID